MQSSAAETVPQPSLPLSPPTPGVVLFAGSASYSLTGRSAPPVTYDGVPETNLYRFHKFEGLPTPPLGDAVSGAGADVSGLAGITTVIAGCTACHFGAIDSEGNLWMWGRNEKGQLGQRSTQNIYVPFKSLSNVVTAAVGRQHSLAITKDGEIYACGDGKNGQLGMGAGKETAAWAKVPALAGKRMVAVAAGTDFSVALDADGVVYTCGSQNAGQCGSGTTGEYIVSAGRTTFEEIGHFSPIASLAGVRVSAIAAGANHGVALDDTGSVYTWGMGGYGRCGHGDPADVLVPKIVKVFENPRLRVAAIAAGSSCSYAITREGGALYFAGITKKSGEATMTFKPIHDLAGWNVRAVSSGATSTLAAADDALVAWGPAPTYGELGYGEATKSSTKPKMVDDLAGFHITQVASGIGASLILVDVSSGSKEAEFARKKVQELPVYTPVQPPPMPPRVPPTSSPVAGVKRGRPAGDAKGKAAKK